MQRSSAIHDGDREPVRPRIRFGPPLLAAVLTATLLTSGCRSTALDKARGEFYAGQYAQSAATVEAESPSAHNRVLLLMERGLMRQQAGDHPRAVKDWIAADALAEHLDYLSLSRQTASLTISEEMLPFRGAPYERVLANTFASKSFLAQGLTDDAAVQARRAIRKLEAREDYPDNAYARYMAGFCLAISGDRDGAALQYRRVTALLRGLAVDPDSGRIINTNHVNVVHALAGPPPAREAVCFIGIGYGPGSGYEGRNHRWGSQPFAVIRAQGHIVGRSHTLTVVPELLTATEKVTALRDAAKTATRIVIKDSVASSIEAHNELAGGLLRVLLFALEFPDDRRWTTLPRWLQVARVPIPPDTNTLTIEVLGQVGRPLQSVEAPLIFLGGDHTGICFLHVL